METAAIGIPLLYLTAGLILTSTGFAIGEFKWWLRVRKLRHDPELMVDHQPAHPPTAPIPITVTKVGDKRRRTAHVAQVVRSL